MNSNKMTFAEALLALDSAGFREDGEFGRVTYALETISRGISVAVLQGDRDLLMTFCLDKGCCLEAWSRERFNVEIARPVEFARKRAVAA